MFINLRACPGIEYAIELWVLVDEALQKLSKLYVRQAISDFVLSVIIAEGLKGFLVAIGVDPHQY
jgi:hypothetical protein